MTADGTPIDVDPGKVDGISSPLESEEISVGGNNLTPAGGEIPHPGEFLSQDETNPDPSPILDEGELVQDARTNIDTILKPKNEILLHYCTNYYDLIEKVPGELVRHVCTIYSRSERARAPKWNLVKGLRLTSSAVEHRRCMLESLD